MKVASRMNSPDNTFALGAAVGLAVHSPYHRKWKVASVERLIVSAIELNQFVLYTDIDRPVGFVSYAFLSPDVERKILGRTGSMERADWNSGPQPWVIDVLAPFGHGPSIVTDLRKTQFPDSIVMSIRRTTDGAIRRVNMWRGANVEAIPSQFRGRLGL